MHDLAEKLFYTLSAGILGAAFFVIQPVYNSDVHLFQVSVRHEVAVASAQTFGENPFGPIADNMSIVVSSVNQFYMRSADAMISLLTPAPSENDMLAVMQAAYNDFAQALSKPDTSVRVAIATDEFVPPSNFMQEDPVFNIIPMSAQVSSTTVSNENLAHALDAPAVNDKGSMWVNLRDNDTGQVYCVAIFNAEVNRYLGPCKNDYQ